MESETNEFEKMFKEKVNELQSINNCLMEYESALQTMYLENHDLQKFVEHIKIQSRDVLSQQENATNALRESDNDKIEIRELNARQKIQLQIALKDRNTILRRNSQLEVENTELKRSLQNAQEMLCNQKVCEIGCKSKELFYKKVYTLHLGLIHKVEKTHEELSEMMSRVTLVGEKATFPLSEQCKVIEKLKSDKTWLEAQVLNLVGIINKLKAQNQQYSKSNENASLLPELQTVQFDVENKPKHKEIEQLQKSLQVAFDTMKAPQSQCKELEQVIEWSKPKLALVKNSEDNNVIDLDCPQTMFHTRENLLESNSPEQQI